MPRYPAGKTGTYWPITAARGQDESNDAIHLYNRAGERQFYFDEEVIGWGQMAWAEAMTDCWPHNKREVRG